jgi:phospholipase/lecithinase/hemolysin
VVCLIVFGDSLCDGGNAHALRGDAAFPCPPHWRGRRCDGPVWVEQLAERLGLPPLRHSLAGGTNHAFGGARSGAGLSPKGMPNLIEQVAGFLEEAPTDPEALVVLRAGANDYLDAPPSPAVGDAVNRHLLGAVERLAAAGLRRFLVPSELPWGFSPIQLPGLGEAERRGLNALIARQNAALQEALQDLVARRGLVVVQPDFRGLFLAVRADPAAYGFTEIGRPVLELDGEGSGSPGGPAVAAAASLQVPGAARARSAAACLPFPAEPCPEALGSPPAGVGYLWWDSWAHLTTAFHGLLADAALEGLREQGAGAALT